MTVGYPFLSLGTIKTFIPQMQTQGVSVVARSPRGFLTAYRRAKGNPMKLNSYWVNQRANFIARHMAQVEKRGERLFTEEGEPTRRHLALIAWAYSPFSDLFLKL